MDIESDGPSNDVHPYVFQKYEFYKTDSNNNIIYRIRKQDKFLFFLNGKWRVRIFRKILRSKYIWFKQFKLRNLLKYQYLASKVSNNYSTTASWVRHENCTEKCPSKCTNEWVFSKELGTGLFPLDENIKIVCGMHK